MKIYTRRGDDGSTALGSGERLRKDSSLPEAYGAVDEAQTVLGLVRAEAEDERDELLAALKAIVDFCDDPNATRRVSLSPRAVNFLPWASGLARLLPKARAAIAEAGKIRTETKTRNPSNTG